MLPLLWLLLGCAHTPRIPGPLGPVGRAPPLSTYTAHSTAATHEALPLAAPRPRYFGEALAEAAELYLDTAPPSWRQDCSGFVCAAAERAGWDLRGNTRSLWELAESVGGIHRRKEPDIGDLAFFDNTYDRNQNGKLDDDLTHVAVVIAVEPDGTVVLAHAGTSSGRTALRMNLRHPTQRHDDAGREINGLLRRERTGDRPGTPYLAGECWRGFATLEPQPLVD